LQQSPNFNLINYYIIPILDSGMNDATVGTDSHRDLCSMCDDVTAILTYARRSVLYYILVAFALLVLFDSYWLISDIIIQAVSPDDSIHC